MSSEQLNGKTYVFQRDDKGELQNAYSPLQNLINNKNILGDFTSKELHYDRYTPVDIIVTDEYDGSENLIINDDKNPPRLINSGFSVQENNTYNIPEHQGNAVTNVYEELTFEKDTQLLKLYTNIPKLDFLGIRQGGAFKCGFYVFYFKLADADGNLSNIVQESGIIQLHIGAPNLPKVRMGMEDENADKSVKFRLSNIDRGFDYIKVFYERVSTDNSQARIHNYFMINQNFPIRGGECDITLTGEEDTLPIDKSEINVMFADIQSAKTQAVVDNTLFLGNIDAYEQDYATLQKASWRIIPYIETKSDLGSVSSQNYQLSGSRCYYNTLNVYENVGYWPDEFYRFGIVYIYDNNLLSPVFNIQGCDLSNLGNDYAKRFFKEIKVLEGELEITKYVPYSQEPDDFVFNRTNWFNSKGVIKMPLGLTFKCSGGGAVTPIYHKIRFDFTHFADDEEFVQDGKDIKEFFIKNHIKGFFFVRQKRVPTIIAQGMVVGLTGKDYGAIPVLRNSKGDPITKSFLSSGRLLLRQGSTVVIKEENVSLKALLVPDYDVNEATLNQIFTGLEFLLTRVANASFNIKDDHHCVNRVADSDGQVVNNVKLTAVPKETKVLTDGENYFSSVAGNPHEPYKTEDVNNKWNETVPLDLTASISLIRGNWGSYVGMSTDKFEYGDIVNIKLNDFKDSDHIQLEYEKRFKDYSLYSAISPRYNISEVSGKAIKKYVSCGRGDCYPSVFTHRMMSNFIDPELPTNNKIIDPACWVKNYAVRCTAEIMQTTHSNLTSDSSGFYIPTPIIKDSVVSIILGILTGNVGYLISGITDLATGSSIKKSQDKYANEICQAFEVYIGGTEDGLETSKSISDSGVVTPNTNVQELVKAGHIKKVNPKEQEQQGGLNLKAIFKSDDKWELHGLASINRADVNAVSFGSWITFPICSSYNLAFRDVDFSNATEEARMNKKRSFYPLEDMNPLNHMLESGIINGAAKMSIGSLQNPAYYTIPYIKQEFFNRIYWSKPNVAEDFINSYRIIFNNQYHEYNKEFGAITKILPCGNSLLVVFQHGIGLLPVNRTPQNDAEMSPYLSSRSVLPTQVSSLTKDYGSMWKDSVIQTPSGITYGVDTVAKKIWRVMPNGQGMEFISDHVISKFLNEWIDLSEYDFKEYQGHINVKTHYNEFKHDVIFTYYKDIPEYDEEGKITKWNSGKTWSLCYNEILKTWITFYDWYPVESCNIDNIFFSFDKEALDTVYEDDELKDYKIIDFSRDSDVETIKINKVFMDKAFTENTNTYTVKNENKNIELDFSKYDYLSFYYKGNREENWINDDYIISDSFGIDGDWKFIIIPVHSLIEVLQFVKGTKFAEFKYSKEIELNAEDHVLKYFKLRSSEGPKMYLWKHGQAGLYDNQGKIKPTHWYGKQHEFNFEFVVNDQPAIQKIFNNLKIISNKTAPNKFEYEVVGEGYEWYKYKPIIKWINKKATDKLSFEDLYKEVLNTPYNRLCLKYADFPLDLWEFEGKTIQKIPFLHIETADRKGRQDKSYHRDTDYWDNLTTPGNDFSYNCSETIIVEDEQLNEQRIHTESLGNDVKRYGRLRGNMLYLEDLWDIEIRPIQFKWAYIKKNDTNLSFKWSTETRHRDKFIKIKVRYSGENLALIQGVMSMFDYSRA